MNTNGATSALETKTPFEDEIDHATVDSVLALDVDKYKYGFETDDRERPRADRAERRHHPLHLGQEGRARLDARMAARRLSPLADHGRAELGARALPQDRLPGHVLSTRRPRTRPRPKSLADVDPALLEMYEKLGVPLKEREILAGVEQPKVAVDAVIDSVSVATTFRDELDKMGIIFCSISEAIREYPELVKQYLGSVVPVTRQLLRDAELGGLHRRLVLLRAQGRALPDGAQHLFPHQRGQDRPVRAHAADRRRGRLCQLPRGLHRADARGAPAARRGGRARRAQGRRDQVLDGPELVPRRQGRQGRHLQFRHQARRLPRRQLQDSAGRRSRPARPSPGSIRAASCAATIRSGEFYSIAISNGYQQVDSGTKMLHLGKNTTSRIISKGIAAGFSDNTYRGQVSAHAKAKGARNFTQCDSLLIGDKCGAHTVPYIESRNASAVFEHEATTQQDLRRPDVLLPAARAERRGGRRR